MGKHLQNLQKEAIRILHNVGYREHTNNLFLNSHELKFMDLVGFTTSQIMYKQGRFFLWAMWATAQGAIHLGAHERPQKKKI